MSTDRDGVTQEDLQLDAFFTAARRADARLPAALVDRVAADAARLLPPPPRASRGRRLPLGWLRELGGWPAAAGFVAASIAGLVIGVYAPDAVLQFDPTATPGYDLTDLAPGYGFADLEG